MFKTSLLLLEEAVLWGGGRMKVTGVGAILQGRDVGGSGCGGCCGDATPITESGGFSVVDLAGLHR